MAARTIEELSEMIARTSTELSAGLKSKGIASPRLQDTTATSFEAVSENAARALVDAARELETLRYIQYHDTSSLGTLLEFNTPALVPLDGTATVAELAAKSGLLEDKLTRFLRYAATNFIFREPEPGVVTHTAASAALARDPQFCTWLQFVLVNIAPISVSIPAAYKKWPQSEKLEECGINAAFGTSDTF
ncbi:Uu.00g073260.m01.CDS01 [Anthostomella pinea]|uniref:Uu.00g073260.m01.CDS01 n=1 Tax=Anthostomella pinea TaxID=933095 RepID=A0AAI8VV97_9PEZI|nr:Uu.00g073260.m01.CDS01 [Anthostomella pinea]